MRPFSSRSSIPLATLPSKQGLKLVFSIILRRLHHAASCYTSIKTRIETRPHKRHLFSLYPSCYTSIKTRIETRHARACASPYRPLATLPSKQGLKPAIWAARSGNTNPSCYTSIKTRIETLDRLWAELARLFLLLHFHQNKD